MSGPKGFYGESYDRSVNRLEETAINKVKQHYWSAKQTIMSKLKKREDEHIIAADAELDAKLEVFYSVKRSCESLLRCIEFYQDYICDLSQEENSLGRFLKDHGKMDKTQAGKMMAAVGRAQGYSAQQRLALRVPLVRLYQDLDVFTERAVQDTFQTVDAMEKARTDYRGSLLWMKNVSQELDPDMYSRLEKFRKVQAQVKKNKDRFDKLKLDCLQKIDLLAASRCNLFSALLANYQNCLLRFWGKAASAHSTVAESFKGYQHFEFVVVKDLLEPSKKLAGLTPNSEENGVKKVRKGSQNGSPTEEEQLLSIDNEESVGEQKSLSELKDSKGSLQNLIFDESPDDSTHDDNQKLLGEIFGTTGDLHHRKKTEPRSAEEQELLGGFDDSANSDMQLLNDILSDSHTAQSDGFWDAFSDLPNKNATSGAPAFVSAESSPVHQMKDSSLHGIMPSDLLDMSLGQINMPSTSGSFTAATGSAMNSNVMQLTNKPTEPSPANAKSKEKKNDQMSAWLNLFADIDPLKNPDAIGKDGEEGRNC